MPEKFNHALDKPASGAIHAEEKNSEKCYGDNHDPGCDKNFSPRRPGYLAHFDANFVQKAAPLAGIFADFFEGRGYGIPATNTATTATSSLILHLQRFRHKFFSDPSQARSQLIIAIGCRSGR